MVEVIRLDGATVIRGGRAILRDITWSVMDDQRWVVLGPNGAGKTTLLALAGTLIHPSAGTVHVLGERLGAVDVFELRPRIGLASATLAERIPADEIVRDVVLTSAWAVTGRWREHYDQEDLRRADSVLAQIGADGLAERRYGTLSEGEGKRVQIARAMMTDPELLLLDEPAANLDLGGREDLVTRLAGIAADRWAPAQVLVTHHVEEIPAGFTHAMLLRDGQLLVAGPIDEVMTGRNLSAAFGLRLRVGQVNGRFWARAATPERAPRGRRARAGGQRLADAPQAAESGPPSPGDEPPSPVAAPPKPAGPR